MMCAEMLHCGALLAQAIRCWRQQLHHTTHPYSLPETATHLVRPCLLWPVLQPPKRQQHISKRAGAEGGPLLHHFLQELAYKVDGHEALEGGEGTQRRGEVAVVKQRQLVVHL